MPIPPPIRVALCPYSNRSTPSFHLPWTTLPPDGKLLPIQILSAFGAPTGAVTAGLLTPFHIAFLRHVVQ